MNHNLRTELIQQYFDPYWVNDSHCLQMCRCLKTAYSLLIFAHASKAKRINSVQSSNCIFENKNSYWIHSYIEDMRYEHEYEMPILNSFSKVNIILCPWHWFLQWTAPAWCWVSLETLTKWLSFSSRPLNNLFTQQKIQMATSKLEMNMFEHFNIFWSQEFMIPLHHQSSWRLGTRLNNVISSPSCRATQYWIIFSSSDSLAHCEVIIFYKNQWWLLQCIMQSNLLTSHTQGLVAADLQHHQLWTWHWSCSQHTTLTASWSKYLYSNVYLQAPCTLHF